MKKALQALMVICAAFFFTAPGHAQWTNPKDVYGESWNCNRFSVGQPLYDVCKRCDDDKAVFYWMEPARTSGKCVPREGSPSGQRAQPSTPSSPPSSSSPSYRDASPRPSPPTTDKKRLWVAIVFSAKHWGTARNYPSKEEAIAAASTQCRGGGCTSKPASNEFCISLYQFKYDNGTTTSFGYQSAGGNTQEEAKNEALKLCNATQRNCTHAVTVCPATY